VKTQLKHDASKEMFDRARRVIAGGESSSVRITTEPLVIVSGEGPRIRDADGNEYLDYQLGFGPLLFGHRPPAIVEAVREQAQERGMLFAMPHSLNHEVGERVVELVPSIELLRFANSGTEAAASAVRTARAATGKNTVLKFEGHYHGWSDSLFPALHPSLEELGPEESPRVEPAVGGLPPACVSDLVLCSWNRPDLVERVMEQRGGEIACMICEPVMSNSGVIPPDDGFLEFLRQICDRYRVLLVFDEVITGFRLAPGGAQERFGVTPDLSVIGKALGGGVPVAAFGGRADLMQLHADGRAFHGGTYSGNPISLAGARAALDLIREGQPGMHEGLDARGRRLADGLLDATRSAGLNTVVNACGPLMQLFFVREGVEQIRSYRDVMAAVPDFERFHRFAALLLEEGVYIHPDQFEQWFVSTEHTDEDITTTIEAVSRAAETLRKESGA
jgi:glutamate-1-semialdehyde 2,1-aminomutase